MKTDVSEAATCPRCGTAMPAGALAGLCPACLLAQGVETEAAPKGPHFVPPPLEELARLFPQLEILGLLGAGGMGAVYKARQPALDRIVALKILPAHSTAGVNFAERFNREARALARLNHPNIVAVHEFGQAGGLHFFLMEFVDGANLRQLEHAGRLAPREALQIVPQICDALQYAHDEGVVHRDIKPENVLVDRRGRVKIADFGLAKILGVETDALRLTAEGQVMGTPHYMAPEQIERPLSVDHRADIYSLGVVLYEMLTGDLPLGNFAPPSRKVQVDVRLDEVVLRALENDPARRYQKASEVKSRVETIAETASPMLSSSAASPAQEFVRWAGFRLVKIVDGVRAVNWPHVAFALAVFFGVLTIPFGLLTLFTEGSLPGWIGIVGLPSVLARLALAAGVVGFGVWRALRAQPPRWEGPQTPQGTVILPPEGFSRKAIIGACWIPCVIFLLLAFVAMPVTATEASRGPHWWQILLAVITLPPGLTAPFGATILGLLAVGDIRRSRGRISGLPLAVFDTLFFPLLAIDVVLFLGLQSLLRWVNSMMAPKMGPVPTPVWIAAFVLVCAWVDYLIIRRVWRAGRLEGDAGNESGDWWWSRKQGAVCIGLACVAIIALVAERRGGFVPSGKGPHVATRDVSTGALVARLPNGGTMELLAVSDPGSPIDEWWLPDGRPATGRTFELSAVQPQRALGVMNKDMVIRWQNLAAAPSIAVIQSERLGGWGTVGQVRMNGQVADATSVRTTWPEGVASATLRVALGEAPWEITEKYFPSNHTARSFSSDPTLYRGVVFHAVGEAYGKATLTLIYNEDDGKTEMLVTAVDWKGGEYSAGLSSTTTSDLRVTATRNFSVPLAQVKEFRVKVRPLRWVEFRNVALKPKSPFESTGASARSTVRVAALERDRGTMTASLGSRARVELIAVGNADGAPEAWSTSPSCPASRGAIR